MVTDISEKLATTISRVQGKTGLVTTYHTTLRHNLEERILNLRFSEALKTHGVM
jgi:hypothetical protein